MSQKIKEFMENIQYVSKRLREGLGLNKKSLLILRENLLREKERIIKIMAETSDSGIKKFGQMLMQVPDLIIFELVDAYFRKC